MTEVAALQAAAVDLFFPVAGRTCPRDYRWLLAAALDAAAPALRRAGAAFHSLNLVHGAGEPALVSGRARLALRLAPDQVAAAGRLAGRILDLAGHALALGEPYARPLLAHSTLYAPLVAAADADEGRFVAAVSAALDRIGIPARPICGRRQTIRSGAQALVGFSVMVHGLAPDHALGLLQAGIGPHRRLGCGVFVPHRSAAAVGA